MSTGFVGGARQNGILELAGVGEPATEEEEHGYVDDEGAELGDENPEIVQI